MRTFLKRKVSGFSFFFCFLTNSVFVKQGFLWNKCITTAKLFYSLYKHGASNSFLLKFFNFQEVFWKLFWETLTVSRSISAGFFAELELIGLGFRIRKIISTVYRFFWGYATFVYLFVPSNVLVEYTADGRTIFFFSNDAAAVNDFSSYLMLLKRLSNYRMIGFSKPGKIVRLKSGKQR